ncbi:MAG TPA: twin-arginine translocation signal domain-containing protein, partial [Terriglobales bacterium]|nr:twin-arginine translocation signal domain-containing protein [Terriglobales bacterium]
MATEESKEISRRNFLKRTAIGSAGLVVAADILRPDLLAATPKSAGATMIGVPFEARERVRVGIIGVGGRGSSQLENLLAVDKVDVKAICDLVPEKVARAQKAITDAGQPEPKGFSKGEEDFKNLT